LNGTAHISDCGQYRYLLRRDIPARMWGTGDDACEAVFVMLNPSTADASVDDPTIRRCIGFATAWGRTGLTVANLYALRSTSPKALWQHRDPVGPENDRWLSALANPNMGGEIICAWGANARPDRVTSFRELMREHGAKLYCLGTTKDGAPRHPLYLKRDARPIPYAYSEDSK
jgi:hypothetical protein